MTGERVGATYAVCRCRGHQTCSCPDFQINRAWCKHQRALAACGLLPARRPRFGVPSSVVLAAAAKGGA